MALEAGWQRYKVAFQYVGTPYSGWQVRIAKCKRTYIHTSENHHSH